MQIIKETILFRKNKNDIIDDVIDVIIIFYTLGHVIMQAVAVCGD